MKICILTHTFPRFSTDIAAPFMAGVAEGISLAGNEVWVLTPFVPGFKWQNDDLKYKIITYKYIFPDFLHKLGYSQTLANDMKMKPLMYLLSPFMFLFGTLSLLRLVKKEKIDIINAHWILPNGFIAALVCKITNTPLICTLPGSDVYMAQKNVLFAAMARFAGSVATCITSNSPQLLADLERVGADPKKFSTIIYGVDPKKFHQNNTRKAALAKKLRLSKSRLVLLGVGRLVAKKGFRYLVETASLLSKHNQNIQFVVVGEGDERKYLESLIKKYQLENNFILVGSIPYQELPDYYNLADIFVLPSVRDETGNLDDQSVAVVEAMACGKPVITTDFPGYRIVVQNGYNGFLVEEKNAKEIAEKLTLLITSVALRKRMGEKSRQLIIKNFTWQKIGQQYNALFEKVVKHD